MGQASPIENNQNEAHQFPLNFDEDIISLDTKSEIKSVEDQINGVIFSGTLDFDKEADKQRKKGLWEANGGVFDDVSRKYLFNGNEYEGIDEIFEEDKFLIAIVYNHKIKNHKHNIYKTNDTTLKVVVETKKSNDKTRTIIDLKEGRILNGMLDYMNLKNNLMEINQELLKKINNVLSHK